jgi:hypothetical protein
VWAKAPGAKSAASSIGVWCRHVPANLLFGNQVGIAVSVTATPSVVAKNVLAITFFPQGDIFALDKMRPYRGYAFDSLMSKASSAFLAG